MAEQNKIFPEGDLRQNRMYIENFDDFKEELLEALGLTDVDENGLAAIVTILTAIKGTGWTSESLKSLNDVLTAIKGVGWSTETLKSISDLITALVTSLTYQHQSDAVLSQSNPASNTWYTILPATLNCELTTIRLRIGNGTAGTVQSLQVDMIVDGVDMSATVNNPTANTYYYVNMTGNDGVQLSTTDSSLNRPFLMQRRSITVLAKVVWTEQPTPLEGRVKYAKR
jgi:hypothetical protein